MKQAQEKLIIWKILIRVVSIVVCAIGASACAFSFTLQIEEIGTMMSSVVWFSGLAGVVASLGGYAATCTPRRGSSYIIPALVLGICLSALFFSFEVGNLRSYNVAAYAILALLVEAVLLIAFRFVLKRNDPNAL